jgi:predicted O-methyltransferase YrrM
MHQERVGILKVMTIPEPSIPAMATVEAVLADVAAFGQATDARETERPKRMLNITGDTGRLLRILVRATGARRILEVGTSNGYSTLWLAWAATETAGHVTTLERAADKVALARANFERAGLAPWISIRQGIALEILASLDGPFDLIFLDADRVNYLAYADALLLLLKVGGVLVTDNVVSHAAELTAFLARIDADPTLDSVTVPVGNGEELTYKRA